MRTPSLYLLVGAVLVCAACGDDDDDRCDTTQVTVSAEGIGLEDSCRRVRVNLLPRVKVDGQWRGAGADGSCTAGASSVTCPAGEAGEVEAVLDDGDLLVRFHATRDASVQGVSLMGLADIDGATTWLSNGFQSWSQSGVLALAPAVSDSDLERALSERGDAETLRSGRELSWWYTFVGGGGPVLFAGARTTDWARSWAQVFRAAGGSAITVRFVSGASGEEKGVPAGGRLDGERWFVEVGHDLAEILTRYGQSLPSRRATVPAAVEVGWNSWYDLWDGVDETAIRANAVLAREVLAPHLEPDQALRIVVDDGWQQAWGEWLPNAKFPSGLDGLADDLKADGFEVGVWLAPLLVTEDSSMVAVHPEWFVDGAVYGHTKNGVMRILDVTHPGAAAHLSEFIGRIVGWGYDLLKIDFLFAGTFEGGRHESVTGMEAFGRAMELIREAAGEETILLAVGIGAHGVTEHADAWRIGADIAFEPMGASFYFAVNQARSIAARWFLCHAILCDPDPPILRDLTEEEVGFGSWVVALAGGGLFLSDDLRDLPSERRAWGLDAPRVSLSLGGLPAIPETHFPPDPPPHLTTHAIDTLSDANTHVLPQVWRMPDGRRVLFNFEKGEQRIEGVTVPGHGARSVE